MATKTKKAEPKATQKNKGVPFKAGDVCRTNNGSIVGMTAHLSTPFGGIDADEGNLFGTIIRGGHGLDGRKGNQPGEVCSYSQSTSAVTYTDIPEELRAAFDGLTIAEVLSVA